MKRRLFLSLVVAALLAVLGPGPRAAQEPAAPSRLIVVISDLHLGVGRLSSGEWHPYEDFRWANEFKEFLEHVAVEGKGAVDLVLNGDTFELWQSDLCDCRYEDPDLGCSEDEALGRINRVLSQHVSEIQALHKFARKPGHRLFIVPGNHDAALLFPKVRDAVLAELDAPSASVAVQGYWLSEPDGLVYAEHGHQIGQDVNSWRRNWPTPFRAGPRGQHLIRPWGEQFVQQIYNDYERNYPIVDNISNELAGVGYVRKAGGTVRLVRGFGEFLKFFFTEVSTTQFSSGLLGSDGPDSPEWNVAKIKAYTDDEWNQFLLGQLPPNDPLRSEMEESIRDGQFASLRSTFSDDDLLALCDQRALLVAAQLRRSPLSVPTIRPCPQKGVDDDRLGAAEGLLFKAATPARMAVFRSHLNDTATRLAKERKPKEPFRVFVMSHTHLAESFRPFDRSAEGWKPLVINTGAWQRTVTPERLEDIRRIVEAQRREKILDSEILVKVRLEDLDPCYPVVWITVDGSGADAKLQYWNVPAGTKGKREDRCHIRLP